MSAATAPVPSLLISPVAIVSAAWGDYWPKYGREWSEWIGRMNPRPCDVVIVTADDIDAPQFVRHIQPTSDVPKWDWFNEAVMAARAEWVICCGVDDLFLPNGLQDLTLAGDAIAIAGVEPRGRLWAGDARGYRDLFTLTHNPMHCGAVFRREPFLRFPWQRVQWADEFQWCELHHAGADVRFDRKPRFLHRRFDESHSINPREDGDREIAELKARLRAAETVRPSPPA